MNMMKKNPFKLIPASYLILIKDEKILLIRRFNTGYEDGNYSVVAGLVDGNETFVQAVVREAKEEVGIDLNIQDLEVVHMIHRKDSGEEWIDAFILANQWKYEPENMEPQKCDDLGWVEVEALPKNMVQYVKQAIENIKKGIFYSEYDW